MSIWFPHGTQGDLAAEQTEAELSRAQRQTERLERSFPHSIDPRGKGINPNPIPFPGAQVAVVNSAIGPCTVNGNTRTPGTGTVDLYYMDGPDATSATADPDNANYPVISWYKNNGANINAGIHVTVIQCGQFALLLGADC
jgi:hypothetical protein